MTTLVLTVIGDDRSGLVGALAAAIADHGGNWDESHMSNLAGKFAGIVVVGVPDSRVDELTAALDPLRSEGLLDITAAAAVDHAAPADDRLVSLDLVGADRPGIVREIAAALAANDVSIEELATATSSAPMAGESLFEAHALLRIPGATSIQTLREALEDLANELMVDIDLDDEA